MTGAVPLGALLGVGAACGLLLMLAAFRQPVSVRRRRESGLARLIRAAGLPLTSASAVVAACALAGVGAAALVLAITTVPIAALLAAVAAGSVPIALLRRKASARRKALRAAWPDAVDTLVSAARAGMSLPDALADLERSGPPALAGDFRAFGAEYRATGSLARALTLLEDRLADPVADRVIAAIRMTREFGGSDLGSVLRTLGAMLREESRTRGEIEARQSWTVSAARMAVAAPWLTLALLCTRPEAARAYASTTGAAVLLVAAAMSAVAYAVMMRIGRLPADERVVA